MRARVAMPMKTMERKEEKLRTSIAIRLPRHPLPHLYFDMGKRCLLWFFVVREAARGGGRGLATTGSCHGKPWAAATLRASIASHGRAELPLCNRLLYRAASYAGVTSMLLALTMLPLMVQPLKRFYSKMVTMYMLMTLSLV